MDHHPIPRRSRELRTNELDRELTMRIVAQLTETVDTQTLRQLICGDQLAVSSDGLHSAHIVRFRRGAEIVVHSELGVLNPRFQRLRPDVGTRILRVEVDSLLVWGKVGGHPAGLWEMRSDSSRFLLRLDRLLRGNNSASKRSIKGVSADRLREVIHLAPWGWWPTDAAARVNHDHDGLSIIETIAGQPHVYRVNEEGITRFAPLTLEGSERVVEVITWQERLMAAVRRGSQSWLVEINHKPGETPVRIQIDGDLYGVWASPTGKMLALLVHPRGEPDDVRCLLLDDERVVHEGRFQMDPTSIAWSPNENAVAVKIHEGDGTDRVSRERIVGTGVDHPIAAGLHLREFLVDDRGRICAAIRHDGMYDQPIIGGRAGTQVPLAWNLHYTPEGDIAWTTVHDDRILTWTQRR